MEVCFGTHPDNEPTQLESPDMKESFAAGLQSQSCLCVQGRFSFFMTSAGEEATAVGSAAALTLEDTVSQKLCLLKQHTFVKNTKATFTQHAKGSGSSRSHISNHGPSKALPIDHSGAQQ